MKKKSLIIALIILLFIILFVLTGCGVENTTNDMQQEETYESAEQQSTLYKNDANTIYMEVLTNKRNYIDENNTPTNIETFSNNNKLDGYEEKITYAILDMDQDEKEEVVALVNDTKYLILNYEEVYDKVYGYEIEYRGLKQLKVNGYYISTGGAGLNVLYKCTFNRNVLSEFSLAEMDVGRNYTTYEVDNTKVTEEEYNTYMQNEFYSKKDVEWIELKTENNNINTNDNKTEINFKEGLYVYTYPNLGMEVDGTKETLTFNNGKITFKMDYFDDEKNGTYVIDGNNIVVTYNTKKLWDQGLNKYTTQSISEKVVYVIESGSLKITEGNISKIYTKK